MRRHRRVFRPGCTLARAADLSVNLDRLTLPPMQALSPRWSWRMYVVSTEGGRPEPVLNEQNNKLDPGWSPDGNSLVFIYAPWLETGAPGIVAVYVLELRTHQVAKLPGSEGLFTPRWSPDGR